MFGFFELAQKLKARYKGPYYYEESEDAPEEEPDIIVEEYEDL